MVTTGHSRREYGSVVAGDSVRSKSKTSEDVRADGENSVGR